MASHVGLIKSAVLTVQEEFQDSLGHLGNWLKADLLIINLLENNITWKNS